VKFINIKNNIYIYIFNILVLTITAKKIYHCTQNNTIALTFDDGPFEYTMDLLDQLQAAKIKATFFINGYNYWSDFETDEEKHAILKRAHADGHQIASHTWEHLIPEKKEDIKPMMSKLDDLIEKNTGYRPKYFRAPQGDCKEDCIFYFEELGYHVIQWDTDTHDWDYKKIGADNRVEHVKKFLTEEWAKQNDNYLILMHDVHNSTVHGIIPWLIKNAPFDKYKFVTVAECLGDTKETHFDAKGNPLPETNSDAEKNNIIIAKDKEANTTVDNSQFELQKSSSTSKFIFDSVLSVSFVSYLLYILAF